MTFGKFLAGGAWAAMAAALALTSVPASAQRDGRGWNNGSSQGAERPSPRATPRSEQSRPQRAQPAQPRSTRPERTASSVREVQVPRSAAGIPPVAVPDRGRTSTTAPNRGGTPSAAPGRGAGRPDRAQQSDAGRGWNRGSAPTAGSTPNRTYADQNRNRTYDGRRDRDRQDFRSGGDRRDGDRNWSGNRGDNDRDWRDGRRDNDRNWRDGRRDNDRNWSGSRNSGYRDGYRDGQRDYRRWDNRSWRNDRRYDWYRYRAANRSIYRLSPYYAPYRNYYYRRLTIGFFLDSLFYTNRYWINDPWRYRLPAVYGPYRWVRYYDDALLVDVYTGEVVDVIYDFFW